MLETFERGDITKHDDTPVAKVARPELIAELQEILQPKTSAAYYVIVGESGTGKSTAVREAVTSLPYQPQNKKEPKVRGVVYFSAPELPQKFSVLLAETVGYEHDVADFRGGLRRWMSLTTKEEGALKIQEEPEATWIPLSTALENVADRFFAKHGRPLVLVIDATDYIAKKNRAFLETLQMFAKAMADGKHLRVVFVTSESATLPIIMASSYFKRATVKEVNDLSDADGLEYLLKRGVPRDRTEDAVKNITGGRLIDLVKYADNYAKYPSNAAYRRVMDTGTSEDIKKGGLKKDDKFFQFLVRHGAIERDVALDYLTERRLDHLLERNILANHEDKTYTFHSRVVETFFRS